MPPRAGVAGRPDARTHHFRDQGWFHVRYMEPRNDDPPWSIPIRDASDGIPHRHATWVDRLPVTPVAIVAVLAFAGVVAVALMIGREPENSGLPPEVLGEQVASAGSPTTTLRATTTTVPPTTATTLPATTTDGAGVAGDAGPAPATNGPDDDSPTPPRDGEPDGLPILGPDRVSGGWVSQLSSVPSSAGGNALSVAYDTVTTTVPDAVILRGSEWAPLRDGFFVIVSTGHGSAADAVDACDASGRTGRDACFGRFLSSIDDTQRTCWRDESGSLAGDCG